MDPNNEQVAFEKSEQNFVPFFQKGDVGVAKKPRKIQTLLEKCYTDDPDIFEIGVDEVGRGPLFGRVYTAAVILPKDDSFDHSKMKDSKKFHSKQKIDEAAEYIKAKGGINNQFLITGFSITQNLKLITDNCYLSSHSALNLIPKPS